MMLANKLQARVDEVELESKVGRDSSLLEEECCLISDQVTREVLRHVDETGDECTPEIVALKQVSELGSASSLSLDLNSSLHHGKSLLVVALAFASKALD